MPRLQTAQRDPSPSSFDPGSTPIFPSNAHLLITTRWSVLSWSRDGINSIAQSDTPGVLVAKGRRDGSGITIAEGQSLALHGQRGMGDPRHHLEGIEGEIQLLGYAENSKTLYFTTGCQTIVQCYSFGQSRLINPAHQLPSPPTILTISPNSQLLLSGSESPRTIYLQNLQLGGQSIPLQPGVSDSPVSSASFHPERPQVFLLAFKDGSLAAYDASQIRRSNARTGEHSVPRKPGQGGEIGRFPQLHAVGRQGVTRSGHVDAKFLPGHRNRAVTVGSDGKCRTVEFEHGGKILKTWHAKGPATSVSVLSVKGSEKPRAKASVRQPRAGTSSGGEAQDKVVIAVGRQDGKVLLFDATGTLLGQKVVDSDGGNVVDVEWVQGMIPRPIEARTRKVTKTIDTAPAPEHTAQGKAAIRQSVDFGPSHQPVSTAPPLIIPPVEEDDEIAVTDKESGTVRHTGIENVPFSLPPKAGSNYMDLFSPVKTGARRKSKSPQKRSTRARLRPRISSTTFLDEGEPSQPATCRVALSPATGNTLSVGPSVHTSPLKAPQAPGTPLSAVHKVSRKRALAYRPTSRFVSSGSSQSTGSATDSKNSRIIAGLRRAGAGNGESRSLFAPYIERHVFQDSDPGRGPSKPFQTSSVPEVDVVSGAANSDSMPSENCPVRDELWLTDFDESDSDSERPCHSAAIQRRFNRVQNYRLTSGAPSLRASSGEDTHLKKLPPEDSADPQTDAQSCSCKGECCGQLREIIAGMLGQISVLENNVKRLEQGHE